VECNVWPLLGLIMEYTGPGVEVYTEQQIMDYNTMQKIRKKR